MKKVKLTQEEEERIKELCELKRKAGLLNLECEKKLAEFWYDFQTRMGGGNYSLNPATGEIWQKTFEETLKEQPKK
jgi:hypothetical protein